MLKTIQIAYRDLKLKLARASGLTQGLWKAREVYSFREAVEYGLGISSIFEGDHGFGNPVGNFDGQGLTCGALGFTWKLGNQQKMLLQLEANAPGLIRLLMPKYGARYLEMARMPVEKSIPEICTWTVRDRLFPDVAVELAALWGSPPMVEIQVNAAATIGRTAYRMAQTWAAATARPLPTMREFLFFFDVAVQNGSMRGITYVDARNTNLEQALRWCVMQQNRDLQRNVPYWRAELPKQAENTRLLFVAGYLRAQLSDARWQAVVMNRRGTMAIHSGNVNGGFLSVRKRVYFEPEVPVSRPPGLTVAGESSDESFNDLHYPDRTAGGVTSDLGI